MDMQAWMADYASAVQAAFPGRVVFAGLQGSRGRGEGRADSDIDAVLILDRLDPADLDTYDALLDTLEHRELICGFTAGREEIAAWEKYDLFQLIRDTTPYVGSLDWLLATIPQADVLRAVRIGAGNIYHMCVHNRLHGKKPRTLARLYKEVIFVLQAKAWLETGVYARRLRDLRPLLSGEDGMIADAAQSLQEGAVPDFADASAQIMRWASAQLLYASVTD